MATKLSIDPETDVKPEVVADAGLSRLFAVHENLKEKTGKSFSAIIDYVEKNELSREVVKKTLIERGLSEASASSEASRIRGMLKPKFAEVRERLEAGDITVAAARKAIAKPQDNPKPAKTPLDVTRERLYGAAVACVREPGFVAGVKEFTTLAAEAYNGAKATMQAKDAEREAKKAAQSVVAKSNGDVAAHASVGSAEDGLEDEGD